LPGKGGVVKIFAYCLILLSCALFISQGGVTGDIYDPLWLWLEPKLGLGWGVKAVLVEFVIIFLPATIGVILLRITSTVKKTTLVCSSCGRLMHHEGDEYCEAEGYRTTCASDEGRKIIAAKNASYTKKHLNRE
jgi:hypothetical protein